jgi:DNA-binding response OmpR family regulator
VEDDPWMQSVIGDVLHDEGYRVLRARSGDEATRLAEGQQLAVILLDLNLPGMSGVDLLRSLGRQPATAGIPVLVVSGHRELLAACSECGTAGIFEKPFDLAELLDAVRCAASKSALSDARS